MRMGKIKCRQCERDATYYYTLVHRKVNGVPSVHEGYSLTCRCGYDVLSESVVSEKLYRKDYGGKPEDLGAPDA